MAGHERAELFQIETVSRADGMERIGRGDGSALLILPAGLTRAVFRMEAAELELFTNPSQRVLPRIAEEALLAFVDLVFYSQRAFFERMSGFAEMARLSEGALSQEELDVFSDEVAECATLLEEMFFPPLIELAASEPEPAVDESEEPKGPSFMELMFPGFLLMALCFMAEGLSTDLWRERDGGTLARMISTPGGALPLVTGKLVSGFFLMLAVSLASALIGASTYQLDLAVTLLFALFPPLAGVTFLAGFFLLQVHTSSQKAGNLLGSLLALSAADGRRQLLSDRGVTRLARDDRSPDSERLGARPFEERGFLRRLSSDSDLARARARGSRGNPDEVDPLAPAALHRFMSCFKSCFKGTEPLVGELHE